MIESQSRNNTIDVLKGILTILVILGHLMYYMGKGESFLFNSIYSFHMYAFFFIGGYNQKHSKTLRDWGKFFKKIILPWLIAVNIYFVIVNWELVSGTGFFHTILNYFPSYKNYYVMPWFHLWYVVSYVAFVILLNLIMRLKINNKVCIIFICVFFILSILCKLNLIIIPYNLGYSVRIYYFFWFFLGYYCRKYFTENGAAVNKVKKPLFVICCSLFVGILIYSQFNKVSYLEIIFLYIENLSLTFILHECIVTRFSILDKRRGLGFIGKYSYSFYLFHMIPIYILFAYIL